MPLPEAVLDEVLRETGAKAGSSGSADPLASKGWRGLDAPRSASRRARGPLAGRPTVVTSPPPLCLATGLVSRWVVREELKKARFGERRRLWEVESLRAISEVLGGTLDPVQISEEMLPHITAMLDARRGEVWLAERGGWQSLPGSAVPGRSRCADNRVLSPRGSAARCSGRPRWPLSPTRVCSRRRGWRCRSAGRRGRLGVIAIAEREVRGGTAPFATTDNETLSLYASQAAVALENAVLHRESLEGARLERELELASAVQRQLLPRAFPRIEGSRLSPRTSRPGTSAATCTTSSGLPRAFR